MRFLLQVLSAVSEAGQFDVALRLVQQMRAAGDVPSKVSSPAKVTVARGNSRAKRVSTRTRKVSAHWWRMLIGDTVESVSWLIHSPNRTTARNE